MGRKPNKKPVSESGPPNQADKPKQSNAESHAKSSAAPKKADLGNDNNALLLHPSKVPLHAELVVLMFKTFLSQLCYSANSSTAAAANSPSQKTLMNLSLRASDIPANFADYFLLMLKQKIVKLMAKNSEEPGSYTIIVKGMNDFKMELFGKVCGLPRGFCVEFTPNLSVGGWSKVVRETLESRSLNDAYKTEEGITGLGPIVAKIVTHGFLPKFSNDDLGQRAVTSSEFVKAQKLFGNKKFSGSLVLSYAISSTEWVVRLKNSFGESTENDLWKQACDLVDPIMRAAPELVKRMFDESLTLCFEGMLARDKCHGVDHNPGLVLTAVSYGKVARVDSIDSGSTIEAFRTGKERKDVFLTFMALEDLGGFASTYNLPVGEVFTIEGKQIHLFLEELEMSRNVMTNHLFDQIVQKHGVIIPGSVTHENICKDILEGIVLRIVDHNESVRVLKYKFPTYTYRTMFLRSLLEDSFGKKSSLTNVDDTHATKFLTAFTKWAKRWVIGDKSGSGHFAGQVEWWRRVLNVTFGTFNVALAEWKAIGAEKNLALPRFHVFLADKAMATVWADEDLAMQGLTNLFATEMASFAVILVAGGVGVGKSSYMNLLANIVPGAVVIDGDDMGLGADRTLSLGSHRNAYTRWLILKGLFEGRVVIISSGCGALTFPGFGRNGPSQDIFTELSKLYTGPFKLSVSVVIPTVTEDVEVLPPGEFWMSSMTGPYHDAERLRLVCEKRNWQHIYKIILTVSAGNEAMQRDLFDRLHSAGALSSVVCVPLISGGDAGWATFQKNKAELTEKLAKVIDDDLSTSGVNSAKFVANQERVLVLWPGAGKVIQLPKGRDIFAGHITLRFEKEPFPIQATLLAEEPMEAVAGGPSHKYVVQATKFVTLKEVDTAAAPASAGSARGKAKAGPVHSVSILLVDINGLAVFAGAPEDLRQRAHVTVSPGDHAPSTMADVARAIRAGEKTVTLPIVGRDGSVVRSIKYDVESGLKQAVAVNIEIHGKYFVGIKN